MADLVTDFLTRLAKTRGDTRAQAALAAEFALAARPEPERKPLRSALDAAAVLHWFDPGLLGSMLGVSVSESVPWFELLKGFPFVERYRRGDADLRNIHESTRLGWRRRLADEEAARFRDLSARAAACFAGDTAPAGRIEWVYHLLCADPDRAAGELEQLNRDWTSSARPEDIQALAACLEELELSGLVSGRARVWVQLVVAWTRANRGESAQLGDVALMILQDADRVGNETAMAMARVLCGDVLEAKGKQPAAKVRFDEGLEIFRRLNERDPENAGWQRDRAVAHSRVGGLLEAQGQLAQGQAAFEEALEILQRLVQKDPKNGSWRRDLAAIHGRLGGVLQSQGQLEAAEATLAQDLEISLQLTHQDPENANWQQDLAASYSRTGAVLQARGKLREAKEAFKEALGISRKLAQQDARNPGWQRNLAVACNRYGWVLESLELLEDAFAAFVENAAVMRGLTKLDPGNSGWRREFAMALWSCGIIARRLGRLPDALTHYREAKEVLRETVSAAPDVVQWREECQRLESELAELESSLRSGDGMAAADLS